ncbi:MAG TPA: DUF2764 family protein [Thermoguttaceae bacterium]|nr:DUF2764 family protein [Thermoguttaceae bacterium]
MRPSNSYHFLLGSLPAMPRHFDVDRVPITQPRLKKRLELLRPEDAEVLERLKAFLIWDRQPWDRTDEEVISHYDQLMSSMRNRLGRHIVAFQMDIRTIMSGLRRRRRGLPPPPGVGQWVDHIRKNWEHPEFRLQWEHPWIAPMSRLLDTTDCLEAQRIKLSVTWNHWTKLAEQYFFSFEAVLLYLVRWEIINRWTSRDAALGRERFEQLVTESLDEHANLYE